MGTWVGMVTGTKHGFNFEPAGAGEHESCKDERFERLYTGSGAFRQGSPCLSGESYPIRAF